MARIYGGGTSSTTGAAVAFSANSSVTVMVANVTNAVYTVVESDVYSMYNSTTGVVTIPVTGPYNFTMAGYTGASGSPLIYVNGVVKKQGIPLSASGVGGITATLFLTAGDLVTIRLDTTSTFAAAPSDNYFSGFLVR